MADKTNIEKSENTDKKIYIPKYISKNLTKDEKILVSERTCGWLYKPACYLGFVLAILLLISSLGAYLMTLDKTNTDPNDEVAWTTFLTALMFFIPSIWLWFSGRTVEMAVTNKRVILKKGIFIHQTDELRLEKVESVNLKKSFGGLIFGYATIAFTGTGNQVVKFTGISHPQKVKNEIDEVFEIYTK